MCLLLASSFLRSLSPTKEAIKVVWLRAKIYKLAKFGQTRAPLHVIVDQNIETLQPPPSREVSSPMDLITAVVGYPTHYHARSPHLQLLQVSMMALPYVVQCQS